MKAAASQLGSGLYAGRSPAGASNFANGLTASRYAPEAAVNTTDATSSRVDLTPQQATPPAQTGLGASRHALVPPSKPVLSKATLAKVPPSPLTSPVSLSPISSPEWSGPPTPLAAVLTDGRASGGDGVVAIDWDEGTTYEDTMDDLFASHPHLYMQHLRRRDQILTADSDDEAGGSGV